MQIVKEIIFKEKKYGNLFMAIKGTSRIIVLTAVMTEFKLHKLL